MSADKWILELLAERERLQSEVGVRDKFLAEYRAALRMDAPKGNPHWSRQAVVRDLFKRWEEYIKETESQIEDIKDSFQRAKRAWWDEQSLI